MYFQDEIRQVEEFRTDTSLVKDKELAMAKMLISSLEADFEPQKYHDEYRDNLQRMIEDKIEGKKVVETPTRAHRAGDRHHGSAEEEPRREAQARQAATAAARGRGRSDRRGRRRSAPGRQRWGSAGRGRTRLRSRFAFATDGGALRFRPDSRNHETDGQNTLGGSLLPCSWLAAAPGNAFENREALHNARIMRRELEAGVVAQPGSSQKQRSQHDEQSAIASTAKTVRERSRCQSEPAAAFSAPSPHSARPRASPRA